MNANLNQNAARAPLVTLPLESATMLVASLPKISIGSRSLEFAGGATIGPSGFRSFPSAPRHLKLDPECLRYLV